MLTQDQTRVVLALLRRALDNTHGLSLAEQAGREGPLLSSHQEDTEALSDAIVALGFADEHRDAAAHVQTDGVQEALSNALGLLLEHHDDLAATLRPFGDHPEGEEGWFELVPVRI